MNWYFVRTRANIFCLVWLAILCGAITCTNVTFAQNKLEGPTKPECKTLSKAVRYGMPVVRAIAVDSAMYGGLVFLWPHAYAPKEGSLKQFHRAWTKPPYANKHKIFFRLDDDPWVINGVLHSLYGSEIYMSARTMHHRPMIAFIYALGASFTWEYLIEGWFQRPSGIDLVWTPFAGAVLGEIRYQLVRIIQRRVSRLVPRTLLVTLLDPLGQLERLFLGCQLGCRNGRFYL